MLTRLEGIHFRKYPTVWIAWLWPNMPFMVTSMYSQNEHTRPMCQCILIYVYRVMVVGAICTYGAFPTNNDVVVLMPAYGILFMEPGKANVMLCTFIPLG